MGELSRPGVEEGEVLEEVAQVLSHDLSNLLVTAQSSLELARRNPEEDHFRRTAAILENSEELVDDLVTLARTGRQFDDVGETDLEAVAESAWASVGDTDVSLEVETAAEIRADRGGLRLLLGNLFQNVIEHGAGAETVRVDTLRRAGAEGFYVADDGDGFATDPDRAFESGHSTAEGQTGLGLTIVARIADAHDWTVEVTDSRAGGARVEVVGAETG